ncbi:MAG: hypothetical protein RIM84_15965 [Alphaproteobacteria bacterium]
MPDDQPLQQVPCTSCKADLMDQAGFAALRRRASEGGIIGRLIGGFLERTR